jgi:hypothetical protein
MFKIKAFVATHRTNVHAGRSALPARKIERQKKRKDAWLWCSE